MLAYKADANSQQKDGETPLHHCSFKGDLRMVTILLENGANPNIQNNTVKTIQNLRTSLHYAVDCNFVDCALLMLAEGGDPYIKDIDNKTSFDLAISPEIEALLRNSYKRSSSLSSFINPFNNNEGAGEGTTYLISDLGDEKCSLSEMETYLRKNWPRPSNVHELFVWLEGIHLEELYDTLADAGYDNSLAMISQMKGPMPITEKNLQEIGISKSGHRKRIL